MHCLIAPKWGFKFISQRTLGTPSAPPHSPLSLSGAGGMEAWPLKGCRVGLSVVVKWGTGSPAPRGHVVWCPRWMGAGLPAASPCPASLSQSHWPVGKGSAHFWTLAGDPWCQLSLQVGGDPLPVGTCCKAVFLETFGWNGGWSRYCQEGFLSLGHTFLTCWLLGASTDRMSFPVGCIHLELAIVWMCGGSE